MEDGRLKPGRKTKYKPEYCQELISHMESGYSFESFGAKIGVARDSVYEWTKQFPEFAEAKKMALDKSLLFWERLGMAGVTGKIDGFNSTVWIFTMKNRFGWRDRIENTGTLTLTPHQYLVNMIEKKKLGESTKNEENEIIDL